MPNPLNVPITPPRVAFIDPRTGNVSREWYMFFLSLYQTSGGSTVSLDDLQKGPPALTVDEINNAIDKATTNLAPSEQSAIEQIAELRKQIDAIETQVRPELGTMSQLQQSLLPWVIWDTTPEGVPPDVGTMAWDGGTTLGVQMTTNVLGRINESGYYYIKASSAITKGQVIMFTGAVGASGVPTGAPATGVTDGSYIMGIAAESIANNGFGLVQFIGTLRGVNLSAYSDGDILWYNPAVTGGLTKTKPNAPNVKVQVAAVISSSNNGTMLIRVTAGSELGGTDSNVQFGTLVNGDLIQYDSALGYWKNVPATTVGVTSFSAGTTGFTPSTASSGAVTLAGTLSVANGGTGESVAGITAFNNITGYTASGATGTTSANLVFSTSPSITTPTLVGNATLSTGNLVQGAAATGFNFSANTAQAGMTSQLLNWYEEGTWTPNQGGGLTVVGAFSSQGKYTRVGRQVTIIGSVSGTTSIAVNANSQISTNLPFATGVFALGSAIDNAATAFSTTYVATSTIYSASAIGATTTISFQITYFV